MELSEDKPTTVVIPIEEKDVSIYSIWIYPHPVVKRGARVVFFRANAIDKIVCYIYMPEEFEAVLGEDYRAATDWVCETAEQALQDQFAVTFSYHNYDTHIDTGELNVEDLRANMDEDDDLEQE